MRNEDRTRGLVETAGLLVLVMASAAQPLAAHAQQSFERSRDRGPGIPTSMFGTYVVPGEILLYPFFEYYLDNNMEYKPGELGYGLERDFRGKYRAREGLLFLGYGISDRLAAEFEAAVITARLDKAPEDPSTMPSRIQESGLGDVEGQLRWRWKRETESRPELFSYFEAVLPLQRRRKLIGTQDWEFKLGTGVVRGFAWGTMTVRAAIEYDGADRSIVPGEYAVEYLKRISTRLRLIGAVEGDQDEVELIAETQWALRSNLLLKLNSGFGLTSKATDWAPEIGLMFSFR